jgi:hypothetical protein
MFSTPTTSRRSHTESPNSPSVTSPAKKKTYTETKTAIGVTTFKKLVKESTIFIDKSLLIKEFIESPAEVLLITCPRRWGKSINMDMIKTFLEIEVDKEGKRYTDKTKTDNYKLFQGTSSLGNLEAPFNIALDKDFKNKYDQYQGEYPVIFVDFKSVKGTNYKEIVNEVKLAISNAFKQHESLYKYLLKQEIADYNEIYKTSVTTQNKDISFLERVIGAKQINFQIKYCNLKDYIITMDKMPQILIFKIV